MPTLTYRDIERQIVERLPELRPAAEYYWQVQGEPGSAPGPYILFEDMFGTRPRRHRHGAVANENTFLDPESAQCIDLYGVRGIIARELAAEGILLDGVPGTTHKERGERRL